jgi:two-component system, NarL family, sensor kinase
LRKAAPRHGKSKKRSSESGPLRQQTLDFRSSPLRPPAHAFQALLDNLEIGVAHADLNGTILYANPRFAEILGQSPRRVIGSDIKRFIAVGSWIELARALDEGAKDSAEGTMNVVSDDLAPQRVIRLSLSPVATTDGRTIEMVATEVTELVQTTKALEKSEALLQSVSARLLQIQDEERRRLARDLHDTTGQELSVVIMTLDQVAKNLGGLVADRQKPILESVRRLRKIESDIRTLSYVLHPPLLDEMGLGCALGWYLDGYEKRTRIEVERDIPPQVPRFSLDKETALFRVIQECLTNVYKHSGSKRVRVRLAAKPGSIEALVEDQGKGFAVENGSRTSRSGVGLQSMRGRLENVGGTFEIYSDASGTRVVVAVPVELHERLVSDPASTHPARESIHAGAAADRRRILIADDHLVARRGIRMLFEGQPDLEICGEASDGLDALQKTKELKPDLLILDLSMPNLGGLSVANRVHEAGLATKILIYTSHSYPQLETTAKAVGCDGYIVKSDATQNLVRATRTILNGGKFYHVQEANAQIA